MPKWIREAGREVIPNFQMSFSYVKDPHSGYLFDYDPATQQVVLDAKNTTERENYAKCLAEVKAGTMTATIEDFSQEFWDAGAIECSCGRTVELNNDWRGTRCECGREYNDSGQELRANWREVTRETGELTDEDFLS